MRHFIHFCLVLCLVACVGFGTGCHTSVEIPPVGNEKDPGKPPVTKEVIPRQAVTSPLRKDWSFLSGEGANTSVHYTAISPDDGSVYVAGNYRFIAHFGKWTIKSESEKGVFLFKADAKGQIEWVKSFDQAQVGGLDLDTAGNPVIAFGRFLLKYSSEGKLLKQKQFERLYGFGGIRVGSDGSVLFRALVQGGGVTFGKSKFIGGNTRMETTFLGKLNAEWEPQWAFHIRSQYNNGFSSLLHFEWSSGNTIWLAGNEAVSASTAPYSAASLPAFVGKVPDTFKGGAFVAILSPEGVVGFVYTGDSITGHGKSFDGQKIHHLSVDKEGRAHVIGISSFDGAFYGRKIPSNCLFRMIFDKTKTITLNTVPFTLPVAGLLHSFAFDLEGKKVFLWGRSTNLSFTLLDGSKITPEDPELHGVWSISKGSLQWSQESNKRSVTQLTFSKQSGQLLLSGALSEEAGQDIFHSVGGNACVEQRSLDRKVQWSVKSEGQAMLYPLWMKSLQDGGLAALIEWNGRVGKTTYYNPRQAPKQMLLRVDKEGKSTLHETTPEALLSAESLPFYLAKDKEKVLSTITVPKDHLAIFHPKQKAGEKATATIIPAQNVRVEHAVTKKDGTVVISGFWTGGRGVIGSQAGAGSPEKYHERLFLAAFSKEGKTLWYKQFDVFSVIQQKATFHIAANGTIYLFSRFYVNKKLDSIPFGDKTIVTDGVNDGAYIATFSAKGELLTVKGMKQLPCTLSTTHIVPAGEADIVLSGLCFEPPNARTSKVFRLNTQIDVVWSQATHDDENPEYTAIVVDAEGRLQVVGTRTEKTQGAEPVITKELFVVSLSMDGQLSKRSLFQLQSNDLVTSATLFGDTLFVAGTTRSSIELGESKAKSNGGQSMFVVRASLKEMNQTP